MTQLLQRALALHLPKIRSHSYTSSPFRSSVDRPMQSDDDDDDDNRGIIAVVISVRC